MELVALLGVASVNDLPHVFSCKYNPTTNKMDMYDAPLSSYVYIFQHQSGQEKAPTSGPHMQTAYPKPDKTQAHNYASKWDIFIIKISNNCFVKKYDFYSKLPPLV